MKCVIYSNLKCANIQNVMVLYIKYPIGGSEVDLCKFQD